MALSVHWWQRNPYHKYQDRVSEVLELQKHMNAMINAQQKVKITHTVVLLRPSALSKVRMEQKRKRGRFAATSMCISAINIKELPAPSRRGAETSRRN